jgi:hypothetical protein
LGGEAIDGKADSRGNDRKKSKGNGKCVAMAAFGVPHPCHDGAVTRMGHPAIEQGVKHFWGHFGKCGLNLLFTFILRCGENSRDYGFW